MLTGLAISQKICQDILSYNKCNFGQTFLSICSAIGYLVFEVSKSKVQSTFDGFLKEANKMYVLLKQEVWWVQNLKGISYLFAAASQNLKPV